MFNGKALEDKFKNLTVLEEEKLEIPKEFGAVGGVGISDRIVSNSNEYISVFDTEKQFHFNLNKLNIEEIENSINNICQEINNGLYINSIQSYIDYYSENYDMYIEDIIDRLNNDCYIIYNKMALNQLKFYVIGNIQNSLHISNNISSIDKYLDENMGTLSDDNHIGSILHIDIWCIALNDIFILSIIDNQFYVYFASPIIKDTIYAPFTKDEGDKPVFIKNSLIKYRLSYYARELLGILIAGYRIQNTGIGQGMVPPVKYIKLTLPNYVKAIEYFEKTGVAFLTNPNLSGIDFDFKNNCIKRIILR